MRSVIILAGGKGTRLLPLTQNRPKPMVDVGGKPFLYWLLRSLVRQGFNDIVISTGYKAQVIESYPWPWEVSFRRDLPGENKEEAVNNCLRQFGFHETGAFVVNGDTYITSDLPVVEHTASIVMCEGVDAGAQFVTAENPFPIEVYQADYFYDIGTPIGLERFKKYFLTHLVNNS